MRLNSRSSGSTPTAPLGPQLPQPAEVTPAEARFFDLLCCPNCRGGLEGGPQQEELSCRPCGFRFPVVDGIPVLFPCDVSSRMDELFGRYWDSEEKANVYDTLVEGADEIFGTYNHESEVYALRRYYDPANLELVLDAGCGNGRFIETLPPHAVVIGLDASLNLLRRVKRRGRGNFLVCGELEHLPFRNGTFGTVMSCRVLQHLRAQREAVHEMGRVTRDGGDMILELYNEWNLKTIYKNIRMSARWRPVFNAPFRRLFKSMSPFAPWGLDYDNYNDWFQVKAWMREAGYGDFQGRGAGFGIHKYLFLPFYINAVIAKGAPALARAYYATCFAAERVIGAVPPWRYTLEKFTLRGRRSNAPGASLPERLRRRAEQRQNLGEQPNPLALSEKKREASGEGVIVRDHEFHLKEALGWLCRAQDATPDDGVSRGYSLMWHPGFRKRGWQPSYPETTGYIIPTLYGCAERFDREELRERAARMARWEVRVQLGSGAVMGGTIDRAPSPAVFNTGQVLLGWTRAHAETGEESLLAAAERATRYLCDVQQPDGSWQKGNSRFADPTATTYNARVGWALLEFGHHAGREDAKQAGERNLAFTLSRQAPNGWFADNCLSDPSAPLLHTICYAMEGLLGGHDVTGRDEYLDAVARAADPLVAAIREDGSLPGRFDSEWRGTVEWSCLTGCAQLADVLLRMFRTTGRVDYRDGANRLLAFLERTQNCVSEDPGLRGGIKGSYPVDGGYGRYEVLNWATKFFADALMNALRE